MLQSPWMMPDIFTAAHQPIAEDHSSSSAQLAVPKDTGSPSKRKLAVVKADSGGDAKKKRKKNVDVSDNTEPEAGGKSMSNTKGKEGSKESEAPAQKTDYIHVRARRGQATDSHSLAERVRREKISERMKYLQDIVPGCNTVTGKASVLDEFINYVQSLQRQVEFLSMKLAAVDPPVSSNMKSFVGDEISSSHNTSISRDMIMSSELLNPSYPLLNSLQPAAVPLHSELATAANVLPEFSGLQRTVSEPVAAPDPFSEPYFTISGASAWDYNMHA